jgi:thiol:disulfide interchange protein DsbD
MQGLFELIVFLSGVFSSGLYIALSPCLFPLLPLFLLNSLHAEDRGSRALVVTSALVLGILSSLVVFGLIAGFVGGFLLRNFTILQGILGFVILFFGLVMLSERLRTTFRLDRLSARSGPSRPSNLRNVYLVGLGYSLLAAPCAGPSILAVVLVFGVQTNVFLMAAMFILLAIAVAIPYLLIALVGGEARTRLATSMGNYARRIEIIAGTIMLVVGLVLILPLFGLRIYF